MLVLDMRTIYAGTALVNILLCVTMLLFWRTRKTYDGFGYWVASNGALILLYLLLALRGAVPDFLSIVVANALAPSAAAFRLEGVKRYLGTTRRSYNPFLISAATLLPLILLTYVYPDPVLRNAVTSASTAILLFHSVWLLVTRSAVGTAGLYRFIAGTLALYGAGLAARLAFWLRSTTDQSLLASTLPNEGFALLAMSIDIALTIAFLTLNSERIEEELMARNQELDAYAHTVAHDLKNPLGAILMSASLLADARDTLPPQEVDRVLGMIQDGAHKMSSIIQELLLLANVRQREEVPLAPLDMAAIVDEAVARLDLRIRETGAQIVLPEAWPVAVGYAPWVEEVWANYLSNALEYGGRSPCVEIGARAEGSSQVRFWVRDNGPGIDAHAIGRLFQPFSRPEPARPGSTGLGLSIVKRIVERLGGQVCAESAGRGAGATFSFTLPQAP